MTMSAMREFLATLRQPEARTRFVAATLALGIFAALPFPNSGGNLAWNMIVGGLWMSLGALAWTSALAPDWMRMAWFVAFVFSLMAFLRLDYLLPAVLLVAWALWLHLRSSRESRTRVALACLLSSALSAAVAPAMAKTNAELDVKTNAKKIVTTPTSATASVTASTVAPPAAKLSAPIDTVGLPRYLTGYHINDITSCGAVDQIPWKFRPDGRKVRLLLKDELRHQTETTFSSWEIYQVMDKDSYVSFIFRRVAADGRYDSIVTKDSTYNRILETAKGPKVIEVQDLRSLINRTALAFYHADGSTLTFSPSSVGRSALIVQLSAKGGRLLPPVFLRGNICDRPEDDENSDTLNKKLKAETTPGDAAAPAGAAK